METQETRTARVTIACTPSEERAVKAMALFLGIADGVSGLLRDRSLSDVLAHYERTRASVETEGAA
jgi:hypothetical protein